jgi:hypothetical protein
MSNWFQERKAKKEAMGFMGCPHSCSNCGHCDEKKEPGKSTRPDTWTYTRNCIEGGFPVKGTDSCNHWTPRPTAPTN